MPKRLECTTEFKAEAEAEAEAVRFVFESIEPTRSRKQARGRAWLRRWTVGRSS